MLSPKSAHFFNQVYNFHISTSIKSGIYKLWFLEHKSLSFIWIVWLLLVIFLFISSEFLRRRTGVRRIDHFLFHRHFSFKFRRNDTSLEWKTTGLFRFIKSKKKTLLFRRTSKKIGENGGLERLSISFLYACVFLEETFLWFFVLLCWREMCERRLSLFSFLCFCECLYINGVK